jgi:tRNA (guanine-N7-)-methyltransferase
MYCRLTIAIMLIQVVCKPPVATAFRSSGAFLRRGPGVHSRILRATLSSDSSFTKSESSNNDEGATSFTPWERPQSNRSSPNKKARFRQHVNPLERQYQLPTTLSEEWPKDVFHDTSRPLHLDIGCGKGGFLLEVAAAQPSKNYLGLEIRPNVVQFARERIGKHGLQGYLDYVGCNANVDLYRILKRHMDAGGGPLDMVSIQFPDPHFKTAHAKRRVVTSKLVMTLAEFMPESATLFLQSDIQNVLDDMRARFREHSQYFQDQVENNEEYMKENIIGIPTEREISVLNKDLPVFRTVFKRTAIPVERAEEITK